MGDYDLSSALPRAEELKALRDAAGMRPVPIEAVRAGLTGTVYGITIRSGGTLVGMGRIIGDGGMFFQIVDFVVAPAHQGKGLGKRIMAALTAYLDNNAPSGAYVSLMAVGVASRLYEQYGFVPTAPVSIGMKRLID